MPILTETCLLFGRESVRQREQKTTNVLHLRTRTSQLPMRCRWSSTAIGACGAESRMRIQRSRIPNARFAPISGNGSREPRGTLFPSACRLVGHGVGCIRANPRAARGRGTARPNPAAAQRPPIPDNRPRCRPNRGAAFLVRHPPERRNRQPLRERGSSTAVRLRNCDATRPHRHPELTRARMVTPANSMGYRPFPHVRRYPPDKECARAVIPCRTARWPVALCSEELSLL